MSTFTRTLKTQTYIVDNTARVLPKEKYVRKKKKKQEIKVLERKYNAFRLMFVILLCCSYLLFYVHLQISITTRLNNIAKMEHKIEQLKAGNDIIENRLTTEFTLDDIKEQAFDLGMTTASANQIVYYEFSPKDFMEKYK